ncbi:MAG: hypothetical protein ACRC1J_04990 [Sandaracinobacteroides sp.]
MCAKALEPVAILDNGAVALTALNPHYIEAAKRAVNKKVAMPGCGPRRNQEYNMSQVARYSAIFASSALVMAIALAAVSGLSVETVLQPFFWICSAALTALVGLAFGEGIGGSEQRMNQRRSATKELPNQGLMA